jgi:EAL domain-containing protein (putative c-di-GMP-specific phosphodiesterase class I)
VKRFPFNSLKIKRLFVHGFSSTLDDAAIIALGLGLELNVIADGAESAERLDYLSDRKYDGMRRDAQPPGSGR